VAAAAGTHRQSPVPGEADAGLDVLGGLAVGDRQRCDPVELHLLKLPGEVVPRIGGPDHLPAQPGVQLIPAGCLPGRQHAHSEC
jgi:hypothetical protein